MKKNTVLPSLLLLALGAGLYALVTWKWNVAAAAWLAPIFLIRYFRGPRRWPGVLLGVLLLWGASYANKAGAWDMEPWLAVAASGIAALPMIAALLIDRTTSRRLPALWATLAFPAAFVAVDYAISFLPFGTVFSLSASQFYLQPLIQVAAITGIWGIEFLVLWTAAVVNAAWEAGWDLRPVRLPVIACASSLALVLLTGGLRGVIQRPVAPTVRVAGVTVAHPRSYWDELIDKGTPQQAAQALEPEFQGIEDRLFAESETAARAGAKVIFWSEADAFLLPEERAAFLQRARDFARQHGVYLMPAYQVLRYGDTSGFNGLALITPEGEVAYEYEKTMTWYATTSDGILHSAETPYGRIGGVVCFDLDFPRLVGQAAVQGVDILLVPAFDTYGTRTYHTEVGLFRAVDLGFSVARMVNEGTSMAADPRGQLLAVQDFFTTPSRIMIADLPTRGVKTVYGALGDWFAWLCIALAVASVAGAALRGRADGRWGGVGGVKREAGSVKSEE